jgi:hypothetical protein
MFESKQVRESIVDNVVGERMVVIFVIISAYSL